MPQAIRPTKRTTAPLAAAALFALASLQCDDDSPGRDQVRCDQLHASAQALVDEYATCTPGDACQVFAIGEHLWTVNGPCLIPFLCSVPVRAGADTSAMMSRAQVLIAQVDVGQCSCAIANCPVPATLEAFCDPATSRCTTRRKQ